MAHAISPAIPDYCDRRLDLHLSFWDLTIAGETRRAPGPILTNAAGVAIDAIAIPWLFVLRTYIAGIFTRPNDR